jgi:hypothetical protein
MQNGNRERSRGSALCSIGIWHQAICYDDCRVQIFCALQFVLRDARNLYLTAALPKMAARDERCH